MCELLGMSSDKPATLSLSLEKLAAHGGPPASISDGWGVAYYEGPDVRLIKDADPANDSDWLRFIETHDLRSHIAIAHIRKATVGARLYRNSQPFTRELAGRIHLFAHNGWMPGIADRVSNRSQRFSPVGETDSEIAFCALLDRMSPLWENRDATPALEDRLDVLVEFASILRKIGPANFLYADGDALFAHGDRRKHSAAGKVEAPGLHLHQRQCRFKDGAFQAIGLSVERANQTVALVASVPLSDDDWLPLAQGEVIALRNGFVELRRLNP